MEANKVTGTYDYSSYTGLGLSKSDGIMTITISNPGRRNAITGVQSGELTRIWEDVWLDPETAVIILTGDGQDFCSGADVSGMARNATAKETDAPRQKAPVNTVSRLAKKHVYGILEPRRPPRSIGAPRR